MATGVRLELKLLILAERGRALVPGSLMTSTQVILALMLPLLLTLIGFKFVGTSSSPYETHFATLMVTLASVIAFSLSFVARQEFPAYAPHSRVAMRFSGCLLLSSLLSVVLPNLLWPAPYIFYLFYFMGFFRGLLRELCFLAWKMAVDGFHYCFLATEISFYGLLQTLRYLAYPQVMNGVLYVQRVCPSYRITNTHTTLPVTVMDASNMQEIAVGYMF